MNGRSTTVVSDRIKIVGQECPTHTGIAKGGLGTQGPLRQAQGRLSTLQLIPPAGNSIAALGMTGQVMGYPPDFLRRSATVFSISRESALPDTARARDIAPTSALKVKIALDLAVRLFLPGSRAAIN